MKHMGLIDGNNFFVSCERLFRPDLWGKPVVVLSSNDGCVVARSQEVKDMGVPMGVPYFKIKDILSDKQTAIFSSNFTLYRDISRRVFNVVKRETGKFEQYSIDEAFFELSAKRPVEECRRLKSVVEKEVGIPVSIGLSLSKTQAKYANSVAKKTDGVTLLSGDWWRDNSQNILLSDIWGVGGALSRRFKEVGVVTVYDLLNHDTQRLNKLFGVYGGRLKAELCGTSVFTLSGSSEAKKSITNSRSFSKSTQDKSVVFDALSYHIREATAELRAINAQAGTLTLFINPSRHGDYFLRGSSYTFVLNQKSNDTAYFLQLAKQFLEKNFSSEVPYNKAGVIFGNLEAGEYKQESLFGDDNTQRNSTVLNIMDEINTRFGKEKIVIGRQTKGKEWVVKSESCSPSYTTNWHQIQTVGTH